MQTLIDKLALKALIFQKMKMKGWTRKELAAALKWHQDRLTSFLTKCQQSRKYEQNLCEIVNLLGINPMCLLKPNRTLTPETLRCCSEIAQLTAAHRIHVTIEVCGDAGIKRTYLLNPIKEGTNVPYV